MNTTGAVGGQNGGALNAPKGEQDGVYGERTQPEGDNREEGRISPSHRALTSAGAKGLRSKAAGERLWLGHRIDRIEPPGSARTSALVLLDEAHPQRRDLVRVILHR